MKKLNWSDPKTLLFLAILLVVIFFIAKYVIKQIQKSNNQKQLDAVKDEINENILSYNNAEYFIMADMLETAMRGPGTDEDTIKSVFNRLRNASDWYKLTESFGIRDYGNWFYTKEGTLTNWLQDDLSAANKKEMNVILSKIGVKI